jgi:hypothetical protein
MPQGLRQEERLPGKTLSSIPGRDRQPGLKGVMCIATASEPETGLYPGTSVDDAACPFLPGAGIWKFQPYINLSARTISGNRNCFFPFLAAPYPLLSATISFQLHPIFGEKRLVHGGVRRDRFGPVLLHLVDQSPFRTSSYRVN